MLWCKWNAKCPSYPKQASLPGIPVGQHHHIDSAAGVWRHTCIVHPPPAQDIVCPSAPSLHTTWQQNIIGDASVMKPHLWKIQGESYKVWLASIKDISPSLFHILSGVNANNEMNRKIYMLSLMIIIQQMSSYSVVTFMENRYTEVGVFQIMLYPYQS